MPTDIVLSLLENERSLTTSLMNDKVNGELVSVTCSHAIKHTERWRRLLLLTRPLNLFQWNGFITSVKCVYSFLKRLWKNLNELFGRSAQLLSRVWLFATPLTAACQASLSITNSWSLLQLMPIELVMPSNHLILCRPCLLLPSIFPSITKLLEENIGRTLDDTNQSKILYDPPPRVMEIKTKVNKWELIKLISFCLWAKGKETISKVKRQTSEWEKIIAKWNN